MSEFNLKRDADFFSVSEIKWKVPKLSHEQKSVSSLREHIDESWSENYLIHRLKEHLATVPVSDRHKTDLLDWYPKGHDNKIIDWRKYFNQAFHYLKIGVFQHPPNFLISLSDLSPKLVKELAELSKNERDFVLKQAVGRIFEDINPRLYHDSVSRELKVELVL